MRMGSLEMKIKLFPSLFDWPLQASVDGDVITINGDKIDLSVIPDGYRLPASAVGNKFFLEGSNDYVERVDGELEFTLRLPVHYYSAEDVRNPKEPLVLRVSEGVVNFPNTLPESAVNGSLQLLDKDTDNG